MPSKLLALEFNHELWGDKLVCEATVCWVADIVSFQQVSTAFRLVCPIEAISDGWQGSAICAGYRYCPNIGARLLPLQHPHSNLTPVEQGSNCSIDSHSFSMRKMFLHCFCVKAIVQALRDVGAQRNEW